MQFGINPVATRILTIHLRRLSVGSNPIRYAIEAQYLPAARPQSIPLFWVINKRSFG
jgi:hypothetical protein